MADSLDKCPKCGEQTWMMNVYVHITAPASMNHQLSKRNLRNKRVEIVAALWETQDFWCSNWKCMHKTVGIKRVRLEDV